MKNSFKTRYPVLLFSAVCTFFLFSGCATIPKGVSAVDSLDKARYLGKWYEIARFDFSFEKNLNNTTAEYTLRKDGYITVLNKGYNYRKNKWESAQGKARFKGADTVGELEVSFFGPFYGGYNIIWKRWDGAQFVRSTSRSLSYVRIGIPITHTHSLPAAVQNISGFWQERKQFPTQ